MLTLITLTGEVLATLATTDTQGVRAVAAAALGTHPSFVAVSIGGGLLCNDAVSLSPGVDALVCAATRRMNTSFKTSCADAATLRCSVFDPRTKEFRSNYDGNWFRQTVALSTRAKLPRVPDVLHCVYSSTAFCITLKPVACWYSRKLGDKHGVCFPHGLPILSLSHLFIRFFSDHGDSVVMVGEHYSGLMRDALFHRRFTIPGPSGALLRNIGGMYTRVCAAKKKKKKKKKKDSCVVT
jgi:hypothetical protein